MRAWKEMLEMLNWWKRFKNPKKRRRFVPILQIGTFLRAQKTARGKYLRENDSYKGSEGFMAWAEWFTWRNRSLNNNASFSKYCYAKLTSPRFTTSQLFFAEPVHSGPELCIFGIEENYKFGGIQFAVPGTAHHRQLDKAKRWLRRAASDKSQYPAEIENAAGEGTHVLDETPWRPFSRSKACISRRYSNRTVACCLLNGITPDLRAS